MQVFLAHVVESANDPALEDAPKALNPVGVHRTNNILALGMVNGDVPRETFVEMLIANPLICAEQADLSKRPR